MLQLSTVIRASRGPFLVLAPVCVLAGVSVVANQQVAVDMHVLALVLFGAFSAHISVNLLNEYSDFRSGLDFLTTRTPFSGGSGALPEVPAMANTVLLAGIISLAMTVLAGVLIAWLTSPLILVPGALGVGVIVTYTRWINRIPVLCLISPGLGFGLLMVLGTEWVLSGQISLLGITVSAIIFFQVNNLLLLNQYPDIKADKSVGRRHIPISKGIGFSNVVFSLFALAALLILLLAVGFELFPPVALLAIFPVSLPLFSVYGAIKYGGEIASKPQYMGANVISTIFSPLLLGLILFFV